jgi:RNA polymerase sigma-70 factor (ECF subfamily)
MSEANDDFSTRLARVRAGDRAALAELIGAYEPEVRIVAHVLLGPALRPHLDTQDLVQSVHKSVLLGLRHQKLDVTSPQHLIALAVTMLRRKVARKWRRVQWQRRIEADPAASYDLLELLSSLQRPQADPARASLLADEVRRVLQGLSATDRRLLELRLEGSSTAEAARELGLDADVLRVRLHRLRKSLSAAGVLDECL